MNYHTSLSNSADEEKISSLRTFERFRISYGHSIDSVFKAVNLLDTEVVPRQLFAENLSLYFQMDRDLAHSIAKAFDVAQREEIRLEDVHVTLKRYKSMITMESLLHEHPFFPAWLSSRPDFHEFFTDWKAEDGAPNVALIEIALQGEQRTSGDLQLIFKWIKINRILCNVPDSRILEVCRSFEFLELRANFNVVTQGDHGDAFYIILEGSCSVLINDTPVGVLYQGMSFGEKALENDAPRAATVRTVAFCKLMVLRSSEYKSLVASAQAKLNAETVEFIRNRCVLFKSISYARLFYMVKKMVRKVYRAGEIIQRQDDECAGIYIVVTGRAAISRKICPSKYKVKNEKTIVELRPNHKRRASLAEDVISLMRKARDAQQIEVKVTDGVRVGAVFGDDTIRGRRGGRKYTYTATADVTTEIIIINKEDVLKYFEVSIALTVITSHQSSSPKLADFAIYY
jgi:CRP-like cAMP-binding protein